jgi:hypothetical protein
MSRLVIRLLEECSACQSWEVDVGCMAGGRGADEVASMILYSAAIRTTRNSTNKMIPHKASSSQGDRRVIGSRQDQVSHVGRR